MATNSSNFTVVGIASGTFSAGVLAAAAVGSLLLGGNVYTDPSLNSNPTLYYGTGAYNSYKEVACTNTGGLPKYNGCSIQLSTTVSGSLMRTQLDAYKSPNAPLVTCRTSPNNINTGGLLGSLTTDLRNSLVASGSSIDSSSGTLVPPAWYVNCWFTKTPDTSYTNNATLKNLKLRVWYNLQHVP